MTTEQESMLRRMLDRAFARNDEAEVASLDARLKKLQEPKRNKCADCGIASETQWDDGTHLCFGCAYGRAGWE